MNKTIVQALERTREIINNPKAWIKDTLAKDKYDYTIELEEPNACKFCISGAIHRALYEMDITNSTQLYKITTKIYNDLKISKFTKRKPTIEEYEEFEDYIQFNDDSETTHEEIIKLIDYAIEEFSKGNNNE